jgi:hypothetical protein
VPKHEENLLVAEEWVHYAEIKTGCGGFRFLVVKIKAGAMVCYRGSCR